MDTRKKDSQDDVEKLSTAKIATVLHEHSEAKLPDQSESTASSDKLKLYESYRPTEPPPPVTDARHNRLIGILTRLDHDFDMRYPQFDKERGLLFYPKKNLPEYKEHPDDVEEGNIYGATSCPIL